ncbi:MAG: C10 family peptidase [Planctomycetota bacterium]|jgi:hypothetical protein
MLGDHRSGGYCRKSKPCLYVFYLFLVFLFFHLSFLEAKPVGNSEAKKIVRGWLKMDSSPLKAALGDEIDKVETFTDEHEQALYYVVYLKPNGFVIVPADDMVEPIIAFVEEGVYNPSDEHPLGALVSSDIPARLAAIKKLPKGITAANGKALEKMSEKAQAKWAQLNEADDIIEPLGLTGVSEIWVAPLTSSTWGQGNIGGYSNTDSCYNYYTPPGPDGSKTNHPCGCVATSMVQLMRYHEYATGGYVWANMPLDPNFSTTLSERQAIGDFCFDAAEAVDTVYGSGGSSAYLDDASIELRDTFGYNNSKFNYNSSGLMSTLNKMANTNLDASYPVILGITGPWGGHAVVCDGYGYNSSTLYHHINMGWDGNENAWYNLPTIDSSPYSFNKIDACVYNVFISGSGEIISGRITEPDGWPLGGVTVSATPGGHEDTSDENGVYALAKVSSATSFTVSAEKSGWTFSSQGASTGTSIDWENPSPSPSVGNVWGVNFTGSISAGYIELDEDSYEAGEAVEVRVVDSDIAGNGTQIVVLKICGGDYETITLSENPSSSGVFTTTVATAEETPVAEDGTIQLTQGGDIYALYEDADDGTGSAATAHDKASILTGTATIYSTNFTGGLPGGWSTVDGGDSAGDTWTSTNPGGRSNSNWTGTFMIVDSYYWGPGVMDEQLITHSIDCDGYENITLTFKHYFYYYGGGLSEKCDVDIRVDGGSWQNMVRFEGANASGTVELSLSDYGADDSSDVQIRWHYHDANYEWWWGIDDVEIKGASIPFELLGDFDLDCDVDFLDYAILSGGWLCEPGDDNWDSECDISEPLDIIDANELEVLTQNWLIDLEP